ncbi:transcriptional repressor [Sporothrix eucalyptigena]|uniref:Transcriptional repressor n=1 Tax=Sporothrix eucalyptigena TaxID=1812306 RepID=A0ABP0BA36_9PEZI
MDGYNASGRRISLLVEDNYHTNDYSMYAHSKRNSNAGSAYSSTNAPELSRSCSFDSQVSQDPSTPLTPESTHREHTSVYPAPVAQSPYFYQSDEHHSHADLAEAMYMKEPAYAMPHHSEREATSDRKGKRYPCRLSQQFNCDKTFTTSGHASRHAKIHFAVKTIPCSFEGCQKMFTRTDNMKQHLETHYKREKSGRTSHSSSSSKSRSSESRSSRHSSYSPMSEEADYSMGVEYQMPIRSAYGRSHSGSSIDSMSLAALADAARQVEDM